MDAATLEGVLGWREDLDLDFKEDLNRTRDGLRKLVSDVVALANAQGGVIIIGIREEDTRAVALTPLKPAGEQEDRTAIHQAVAEYTAPSVPFEVHQVEAGEDGDYYLVLAVPKSQLAPHAIRRPGEHSLRYPVRDGTRTRYLAEAELADRYRDRFRLAGELVEKVERVQAEGEELLHHSETAGMWLSLSIVPEAPGRFEINSRTPAESADWMKQLMRDVAAGGRPFDSYLQGGVGYRRVLVGDWEDQIPGSEPSLTHCQLHVDGSGFFGQRFGFEQDPDKLQEYRCPPRTAIAENDKRVISVVTGELLFDSVVTGMCCLAQHALDRCGADGDAVVLVRLVEVQRLEATVLASNRAIGGASFGLRQTPGTHELRAREVDGHTFPLRVLHSPSREMMAAVHLLMVDVLSLFGHAGVDQVTNDGSLLPRMFGPDLRPDQLSKWARSWGIHTE